MTDIDYSHEILSKLSTICVRSRRLEVHIEIPLPELDARAKIIEKVIENMPVAETQEDKRSKLVSWLAQETDGERL